MKRKAEEEEEQVREMSSWSDGRKWKRGRLIGKGEFGSVFFATLKEPNSKFSCFPSTMAVKSAEVSVSCYLQKEKQALDNLQGCPNVIKCFSEEITDSAKGEMIYNLLFEFASGGTLADQIKKSGGRGLPEINVKRYTRAILQGLVHVHERSYVHCDLKPENILLVPNPNQYGCDAKIGDFGLAKRTTKNKRKIDPYLRGTAMYMAPETIVYNVQEAPSDVWALGCVVLQMLTRNAPWPNLNTEDILRLISDDKELPNIPSTISKEGKEFLKGCFVRKTKFRLTAEMFLYHPFLKGCYGMNVDELTVFPLIDQDEEVYYSSLSDDGDSIKDVCSSSKELKDIELFPIINCFEGMKPEGRKGEATAAMVKMLWGH